MFSTKRSLSGSAEEQQKKKGRGVRIPARRARGVLSSLVRDSIHGSRKEWRMSIDLFHAAVGFATCFVLASCSGSMPQNLGVRDGRLAPCPASPNCVSSRNEDKEHTCAPLPLSVPPAEAIAWLKTIITRMPRAKIVTETDTYLHVEFRSAVFRFVDDAEFFIDQKERVIHLRSAARTGYSDFGVNRKRMNQIIADWRAFSQ